MPARNHSIRPLALLGALALVAIFVVVLLVLTRDGHSGRAGHTSARPRRTAGLESIFEDDARLQADPARTLDLVRRLGVDTVAVYLGWGSIAPHPNQRAAPKGFEAGSPQAGDPGRYPASAWRIYDTIVRDATVRHIGLEFTLGDPPPLWASAPGAPVAGGPYPQWTPSAVDYGTFVRAVATRYSGSYKPPGSSSPLPRIDSWGIWNEPNYGPDLAPQAIDDSTVEVAPRLYRRLVDAAWTALHATGHGRDRILIGELAPRGITVPADRYPGNFSGMVPLRFLRALYCVDSSYHPLRGAAASLRGCPASAAGSASFAAANPALFKAGGFAVHPYPQGMAPNLGTPDEPDYADLPVLPLLESVLDTLQGTYRSRTRFPIYSTEYGYRTNPPESLLRAIGPALAAYYINWAEYISWRDPRVRSYDQYLLADSAQGSFATGLEFADGAPKATFYAYRLALYLPVTSARAGQPLEVWGCVRPARFARRDTGLRQRVEIQFEPHGSGAFRTVTTVTLKDPYGYFDVRHAFAASGAVRLTWSYPDGTAVLSRTVSVTIR